MEGGYEPFYRISSLVSAKDLQQPLAQAVEWGADAVESWQTLSEEPQQFDKMSLVLRNDEVIGWWWPHDEDIVEGTTVGDTTEALPHSMMLSSNSTFYDIADAFARRQHFLFFVLDGTEITGTISYLNLFSRTGQLCLLSLTFLLETVTEDLCMLAAELCWKTLSDGRKQIAQQVCDVRFKPSQRDDQAPPNEIRWEYLIRSTTFVDKGTMLARSGLLPTISNTELKSVFARAEKVRNLCAHAANEQELIIELPRKKFAGFLHRTLDLVETIKLKTHALGSTV